MFTNMDYVYAVYQEKSFSRAADRLFISQPSLSITIKRIEEKMGLPIFNRRTNPISLTPFGVEYIQAVEQIRAIEDRLRDLAEDQRSLKSGSLAVGGSNFGISYLVPRVLADFKKKYPSVELKILEMNTRKSRHLLDTGELDLVITNQPFDTAKYERLSCYREHLILAVPENFPVKERLKGKRLSADELGSGIFSVEESRCVSVGDLEGIPFILLKGDNYLRRCTDMIFQEAEAVPNVVLETDQSSVSYNFSRMGIGATILSNRLAEDAGTDSGLAFYKIGSRFAVRDTFLCYRKGVYFTYAMKTFTEMLLKAGQEKAGV